MLGASHLSLAAANSNLYDPYWSSVVLLLGFENTLADASLANSTVSTSTVLTYSTSPAKFDTYSVLLPSAQVWLNVANTSSFYMATGDFTIETWAWTRTDGNWGSGNVCIMDIAQQLNGINGGPSGFFLTTSTGGVVTAYKTAVYDNTAMGFVTSDVVLPALTWNHIVTGRQGSTFYLGTNGTLKTAGTSSKNWFPYNVKIKQDAYGETRYPVNFDEFRVTKGVWRYGTGTTYTVPTARFPRQ
jgi:hypothetical protein